MQLVECEWGSLAGLHYYSYPYESTNGSCLSATEKREHMNKKVRLYALASSSEEKNNLKKMNERNAA